MLGGLCTLLLAILIRQSPPLLHDSRIGAVFIFLHNQCFGQLKSRNELANGDPGIDIIIVRAEGQHSGDVKVALLKPRVVSIAM